MDGRLDGVRKQEKEGYGGWGCPPSEGETQPPGKDGGSEEVKEKRERHCLSETDTTVKPHSINAFHGISGFGREVTLCKCNMS